MSVFRTVKGSPDQPSGFLKSYAPCTIFRKCVPDLRQNFQRRPIDLFVEIYSQNEQNSVICFSKELKIFENFKIKFAKHITAEVFQLDRGNCRPFVIILERTQ